MPSKYLLSERMGRIDSSQIRRAFDLAAKLENPVNLSIGQPHFPTPEPIAIAMEKAIRDGYTAYTQTYGILPLRERLSRKFREVNGFQAEPDNILVSAGVSALLQLLFLATIDPGDRVIITDPAFLIYRSMLSFFNAKIEYIPELFTSEDLEPIDPNGLKMILFSSPSNPSGHIMTAEQLRMLSNLAERSGALMVSDEIYELFDYDQSFTSTASIYDKTVTLTGFSKTYSMTGLRLAAATGPREIIQALATIQQYTVVCAPSPAQWGGLAALDVDMSDYVNAYKKNRDRAVEALKDKYKFSHPDGAFYLYLETGERDMDFVDRAVREQKLIVVPGSIFSPTAINRIRMSYAVSDDILERGLSALRSMA